MTVAFTNKFLKQVSKISIPSVKKQVIAVIEAAEKAETLSEIKNLKKLTGYANYYRIRVGDYRIGCCFKSNTLEFAAIDHRKDIYKYFP
jgi:mRNA interferase RelE/StbE